MIFVAARFITAVVVIWSVSAHWPNYNYYVALRAAVFAVTLWGAFTAYKLKDRAWLWAFAIIAVLYNPIFIIHLSRPVWQPINIMVGIALLISLDQKIFALSRPEGKADNAKTETASAKADA
jgi:hypothetical protein